LTGKALTPCSAVDILHSRTGVFPRNPPTAAIGAAAANSHLVPQSRRSRPNAPNRFIASFTFSKPGRHSDLGATLQQYFQWAGRLGVVFI
ncbi:hypothetical protein, partial [Primorskyibacter sp. 2E233]|uniref:hypothetical protein n=1 Tax=Primorskyibacter sp. 2E233 TaxID=3413431 RepID=UPI003BF26FF3